MDALYYDTFGWDYDISQGNSHDVDVDHLRTCFIYGVPCNGCRELDAPCYMCIAKLKRHARQCHRDLRRAPKTSTEKTVYAAGRKSSTDNEVQPLKCPFGVAVPSPLGHSRCEPSEIPLLVLDDLLDECSKPQRHQDFFAGDDCITRKHRVRPFAILDDESIQNKPNTLAHATPKPPIINYSYNIMMIRPSLLRLPYISWQGIGRTVYTLPYMRGTAHAIGVWANCEHGSFEMSIWDWVERKRRVIRTEGVIGTFFGTWRLTRFDVD